MAKGLILSLCDLTGNAVKPWVRNGYTAVIVDLQHPEGESELEPGITRVGCDVRSYVPPGSLLCLRLPSLHRPGGKRSKALPGEGVACAIRLPADRSSLPEGLRGREFPYLIENPVSTLATYWRKPDYRFDPCDYAGYLDDPSAEAYTKRTCLWVGNGFRMPEPKPVEPKLGSKMHRLPPSAERANLRSATPKGFAEAVFQYNRS